jgi:DNA-binding response OmpR family regulator
MKILVVDDDPIILDISQLLLGRIGYDDVHLADNAEDALARISETRAAFDCILLDINMPQVSGIELIPQIRAVPGYESVPIIMTTSMESPQYITASFIAGAWDYLVKPFEVFDLESRMHAADLHRSETARWLSGVKGGGEAASRRKTPQPAAQQPDGEARVGGLVSPIAFENCLLKLLPAAEAQVEVRALGVRNLDQIKREIGTRGLRRYLEALTDVVVKDAAGPRDLVCYQGGGIFLILSWVPLEPGAATLTLETQVGLEALDAAHLAETGLRSDIGLSVARQLEQSTDSWPLELISSAVEELHA